jgi:hypothetical protein
MRVLVVVFFLCLCGSAAGGQTVQFWENSENPAKDLELDSRQCVDAGRSYVARTTPRGAIDAPTTNIGRALDAANTSLLKIVAQKQFDNWYSRCMDELGWTRVSPDEIAQRKLAQREQIATKELAKSAAEAESEAQLQEYLHRVPKTTDRFDEFTQLRIYSSNMAHIPNKQDVVLFQGGFSAAVGKDGTPEANALLIFETAGDRPAFREKPELIVLVDGGPPNNVPENAVEYSESEDGGFFQEQVIVRMSIPAFLQLSAATEIRARLGDIEFTIPDGHMRVLREIASKLQSGTSSVAQPTQGIKRKSP